MQSLIVVIVVLSSSLMMVSAVPPPPSPRRSVNSRFSSQYVQDSYLPTHQQQQQVPHETYGPPPTQAAANPPKPEYGPPPQEEPTTIDAGTVEITTANPDSESIDTNNTTTQSNATTQNLVGGKQGVYYLYHPSGLLQKVLYSTKNDLKNMAYSAQVKYQNVEPIREPIFTYNPQTLAFTKLEG